MASWWFVHPGITRVGFIAKEALEHQFLAGNFLRRIGTVFVDRFDARKGVSTVRNLTGGARTGGSLVFFPEGTFKRSPGLLPFHLGAFLIAVEANLPVVPMAIRGSRSVLRGTSHTPSRGPMSVTIGEPIPVPASDDEQGSWNRAIAIRDAARAFILQHCGEPDLGGERSVLPNPPGKRG